MNNINVERLSATSEAAKNTPSSRFLPFSVNLTWEDGTRNRAVIRDFSSLTLAEPEEFGGENEGPNPVEYLLTGAISCFSISLELILSQREIKLNAYHATIEGKVDMAAFFGHIDGKRAYRASRCMCQSMPMHHRTKSKMPSIKHGDNQSSSIP